MSDAEQPAAPPKATNVVVWGALAFVVALTGVARLAGIYPLNSAGFLVASVGAIGRGLGLGAIGLVLELYLRERYGSLAPRARFERSLLNWLWALALIFSALVAVDGFTDAFLGYHATRGIRILFSGGLEGMGPAIEAVGMSPGSVLRGVVVLLLVIGGLYGLFNGCSSLSAKLHWHVTRRSATALIVVTFAALIGEQLASPGVKTPLEWERELRAQPLEIPAAGRPEADLASFAVHVPVPAPLVVPEVQPPADRPDILMLVIESFRRDAVDSRVTPELLRLLELPRTRLLSAATTGNVTHYAWYGMFTGTYPFQYNHLKALHSHPGSVPLGVLGAAGYEVRIFTTASLDYQDMGPITFGAQQRPWLHLEPQPVATTAEEKDREATDRFLEALGQGQPGGRLFVLGLNSSHFDYAWPADFTPPPDLHPEPSLLEGQRAGAERLHERYRHALGWVDNRAGLIFKALRERGQLEKMIIIVTGDHGEAFNEHGVYAHGTDLSREQLEVPIFLHLPGEGDFAEGSPLSRPDAGVAHVDLMPTILEHLGLYAQLPAGTLAGQPLQRPGPEHPRLTFQGWSAGSSRFALHLDGKKLLLELNSEDALLASRLRFLALTTPQDELSEPNRLLEWTDQLGPNLPFISFP